MNRAIDPRVFTNFSIAKHEHLSIMVEENLCQVDTEESPE